jgi:alanine racemase
VPAVPAVKANGYGLGAREVVALLERAGARAFAVSSWAEAEALARPDLTLLVLHGFTSEDAAVAASLPNARPVLNTPAQCRAWHDSFPGRPADLMVETGMNRLGLAAHELSATAGLQLHTLHGHLACADTPDHPLTARQVERFRALAAATPHLAHALANSAGIAEGLAFDAVRPGLMLYGGRAHPALAPARVVTPEARVIQVREVAAGESVGYGAAWTASAPARVAILNIGYADGVARALGPNLKAAGLPLAGRISMDMVAVDVTGADIAEGDWLPLDWDLPALEAASGVSQYELLTGLGARLARVWR